MVNIAHCGRYIPCGRFFVLEVLLFAVLNCDALRCDLEFVACLVIVNSINAEIILGIIVCEERMGF